MVNCHLDLTSVTPGSNVLLGIMLEVWACTVSLLLLQRMAKFHLDRDTVKTPISKAMTPQKDR